MCVRGNHRDVADTVGALGVEVGAQVRPSTGEKLLVHCCVGEEPGCH